ncbi:MAG: ATP-grasp domain-containing protein [Planctomycetota bacterium]|jgi:carbamoyl-phosphate synthase large subunit
MAKSRFRAGSLNVLFTCIGRRVSLLDCFRGAARQLKIKASFFGTDATELSPALQLCDKRFIVKPISHPGYLKQLLEIVKQNKVKLVVPTIDTELLLLAKNKSKFANLGCCVLISEPDVIEICQDKRKTHKFLVSNGFDTPETISPRSALSRRKIPLPCLLKPWDGAAGKDITVVNDRKELAFFARKIPNAICQELLKGAEHTCDVYVDFGMKVRCVVPRKRIKVRAGEVSKGQVVKNKQIMNRAAELVTRLKAGPGVITVQCFLEQDRKLRFNEINPRFGGGVPLAIKAGANFPKWIFQELLGKRPRIKFDGFKDGLTMLRYDAEVWLERT